MPDPKVAQCKQQGEVYCWKYRKRRNFPGWNLTADLDGCGFLLRLLDLMIASPYSSTAKIRISRPTMKVLGAVNGPAYWSSASALSLTHPKTKVEAAHWNLKSAEGCVTITAGEARLRELRDGVTDISQGHGDWAAPNDNETIEEDQLLYFWPALFDTSSRANSKTA